MLFEGHAVVVVRMMVVVVMATSAQVGFERVGW